MKDTDYNSKGGTSTTSPKDFTRDTAGWDITSFDKKDLGGI